MLLDVVPWRRSTNKAVDTTGKEKALWDPHMPENRGKVSSSHLTTGRSKTKKQRALRESKGERAASFKVQKASKSSRSNSSPGRKTDGEEGNLVSEEVMRANLAGKRRRQANNSEKRVLERGWRATGKSVATTKRKFGSRGKANPSITEGALSNLKRLNQIKNCLIL